MHDVNKFLVWVMTQIRQGTKSLLLFCLQSVYLNRNKSLESQYARLANTSESLEKPKTSVTPRLEVTQITVRASAGNNNWKLTKVNKSCRFEKEKLPKKRTHSKLDVHSSAAFRQICPPSLREKGVVSRTNPAGLQFQLEGQRCNIVRQFSFILSGWQCNVLNKWYARQCRHRARQFREKSLYEWGSLGERADVVEAVWGECGVRASKFWGRVWFKAEVWYVELRHVSFNFCSSSSVSRTFLFRHDAPQAEFVR